VYIYPRVSGIIRVSGIRGFGFGDGFPPESVFGSGSGFDFGFRFCVHGDSTRSEPDPLSSLSKTKGEWARDKMPRPIQCILKVQDNFKKFSNDTCTHRLNLNKVFILKLYFPFLIFFAKFNMDTT
jgi:hypothetical protein